MTSTKNKNIEKHLNCLIEPTLFELWAFESNYLFKNHIRVLIVKPI